MTARSSHSKVRLRCWPAQVTRIQIVLCLSSVRKVCGCGQHTKHLLAANAVLPAEASSSWTLAGSGERFLGLLPLKGERDMLIDIRRTPTAIEIVHLSTLLEVRP